VGTAVRFALACLAAASVIAFGGRPERPREDRGPALRDPDVGSAGSAGDVDRQDDDGRDDVAGEEDPSDEDEPADEDRGDEGVAAEDDVSGDEAPERGAIANSRAEWAALADAPDGGKKRRRRGGCPSNMIRVRGYCIDRYEAPNRRGARPLAMQSANDAVAWCSEHHKRLCTEDEWIIACEGEEHRQYPYGAEHVDGRCNDDKPWRKVDEATLAKWPSPEAHALARDLYQATPSGWKHKCASETGVRDLTGNVEEWVARTREHANDYPYILIGCYWSGCYGGNKPTCHSTNNAHGPEFRFYETGFRCCRDAPPPPKP
jgi:hypothetical protein